VQDSKLAGATPLFEQLLPSTVAPSERWHVTLRVAVPVPVSGAQVPERVWVKPVPQPAVGVQAV
jgi:hypothetical protein